MIFYCYLFFNIPTLCVEIWLENFNEYCKEDDFDACLHYGNLSKVFSTFFFLFYSILQYLSIIVIFSSIVKFISGETLTTPTYIRFIGNILALGKRMLQNRKISIYLINVFLGTFLVSMTTLTLTAESSYDSVQNVLERTEERLLRTREKSERQKLKYEIRKLSKLEPMTGGGFFQISKSTLTSMLSVR